MIEVINRITGSKMRVAEDRLSEYLAAGHKLAAVAPAIPEEPVVTKPVRKASARAKKTK